MYYRAHSGYLHVDFKTRTQKRAIRKSEVFLQIQSVGQLTTWGYGGIRWVFQTSYDNQEPTSMRPPRFIILKGLPPSLTSKERQLIMAALLHDLVDNTYHPSKLGFSIAIPDPYVQWLCEHHHTTKKQAPNPDLQLLQAADARTSQYARVLPIPTFRRKMAPVNTQHLAKQLEQSAQGSIYQLYSVIYQSEELQQLTASKTHPTESLRQHLLSVANWVLFFLRTPSSFFLAISIALVGNPSGTLGPVEMEDSEPQMSHSSVVRVVQDDTSSAAWTQLLK